MWIVASRGRNPENPNKRTRGLPTEQRLEINSDGICNCLTSVQKDNLLIVPCALRLVRDDFAKKTRKSYENHEISYGFNEHRQLEPRTDNISNTITTLQKDNYILDRTYGEEDKSKTSS